MKEAMENLYNILDGDGVEKEDRLGMLVQNVLKEDAEHNDLEAAFYRLLRSDNPDGHDIETNDTLEDCLRLLNLEHLSLGVIVGLAIGHLGIVFYDESIQESVKQLAQDLIDEKIFEYGPSLKDPSEDAEDKAA